jgi:hypothetical protein
VVAWPCLGALRLSGGQGGQPRSPQSPLPGRGGLHLGLVSTGAQFSRGYTAARPQELKAVEERGSPLCVSEAYDWAVSPEADHESSADLPSWPAPRGGYEPMPKSGWRTRRRRPLRRWEVTSQRVMLAVEVGFTIGLLVAGPPSPSLWHAAAIGFATWVVIYPATWPRYWLLQLLGLRPPAQRAGSGALGS